MPGAKKVRLLTRKTDGKWSVIHTWYLTGSDDEIVDKVEKMRRAGINFYEKDIIEIEGKRCFVLKQNIDGLEWIRGLDSIGGENRDRGN